MDHIERLTRYAANFVDELVKSGLQNVVISPGSRSTPLAMTLSEHEGIKEWVIVDERSAAFFALGIAKKTKCPVAIVCTSGTAVANYFPAIIEAHYGRVPLIVLTADRPHELRDIGAPQAIEQIKIFGDYVKWFHEMALPEATPKMLRYVRGKAARAVHVAGEKNAGPVHLNFPFREPLIPDLTLEDLWGSSSKQSYNPIINGEKKLSKEQLTYILSRLENKEKGVIVCGPQVDEYLAEAIVELASVLKLPVLADPLSQLRAGGHDKDNIIENYDAILRNKSIREQLKADFIIRFGAMPVSKMYLFYVQEQEDVLQFLVEDSEGYRDPLGNATEYIHSDAKLLCNDIINNVKEVKTKSSWLENWQHLNNIAKDHINRVSDEGITEGEAVRCLLEALSEDSSLFVGNSMAVRDLDTFFMTTEKNITILANRGASGIDGVVSSGLGAAAVSKERVTLLIGDLSFYHDLNGLLAAKQYQLNMTVLLINNDGGGIFSFLPQVHNEKHFEALFGTPLDIDFEHVIKMYRGKYKLVTNEEDLHNELVSSNTFSGLVVIEVKTDRSDNIDWHRRKWLSIEEDLLKNGDN